MQCIKTLGENQKSPLQRFIEARAIEDSNMVKGGSWSAVQHAAGRLLSYQYAAQTLVHGHHIWAESDLFREFDVVSVRSSKPYPAAALKLEPESVEAIIHRAPGIGKEQLEVYKAHAAELQRRRKRQAQRAIQQAAGPRCSCRDASPSVVVAYRRRHAALPIL